METNIEVGDIVLSRLGHDSNQLFIVVGLDKSGYFAIMDGKSRKRHKPKYKNPKHLIRVAHDEEILQMVNSPLATDAEIYKLIKKYKAKE